MENSGWFLFSRKLIFGEANVSSTPMNIKWLVREKASREGKHRFAEYEGHP